VRQSRDCPGILRDLYGRRTDATEGALPRAFSTRKLNGAPAVRSSRTASSPSFGIDLKPVGAAGRAGVRGVDRVRRPADPTIVAGFACALANARAVTLAA
jgi:hypothetical protein